MQHRLISALLSIFVLVTIGNAQDEFRGLTADQKAELEVFKKTMHDGKPPVGWEKWPKFMKARNKERTIKNQWRVEFVYTVGVGDVHRVARYIVKKYGGKIISVIDNPLSLATWVEVNEAAAERISRDPRVRRVRQNEMLELRQQAIQNCLA
jgi:hypothetical protein